MWIRSFEWNVQVHAGYGRFRWSLQFDMEIVWLVHDLLYELDLTAVSLDKWVQARQGKVEKGRR